MKSPNSVSSVLRPLYRGIPVILVMVAVCVVAARRYVHYATPMYESTAKIQLADTREGVPNANLYKDLDLFVNTNRIGTEVEVLKSQLLIGKVADLMANNTAVFRVGELQKKELYDQSPLIVTGSNLAARAFDRQFDLVLKQHSVITLKVPDGKIYNGRMNEPIQTDLGIFTIRYNNALIAAKPGVQIDDHYAFLIHSREKMIDDMIAHLDVTSVEKDIPILRVSYKSAVARKSADIVNLLAETYISDYIDQKYRSADTAEDFLTDQLKEYSRKLASSENNIQAYRDDKQIINIHQETETDLRKIADLKKQLASVKMNLEAIDSLNVYIKSGRNNFIELAPNFEAFNDLLSTEIIKQMKQLQAEKRELMTRYTPEDEKVQVTDRKIGDLSDYMQESIRNTETNLRIKYNDLQRTIQEAQEVFTGLPEKERNMTIMERDFGLNEQIYKFLQEKRTDAKIAKAATISFHRIIARGEVPDTPVSPNAKLIAVFAGFLGFIFSLAGIYIIHGSKGRVDNRNVIYRHSDTPLAQAIPFCKTPAARRTACNRWALELELKGFLYPGSVLCFSSVGSREGKTFLASGLAEAIASLDKRVLLIAPGQSEETHSARYQTVVPEQLSAGWSIPAIWATMLAEWQRSYDVLIVDNFPVSVNNSMVPMSGADKNFMVLDSRLSRIKDIDTADDLKERLQIPHMEFVLNREAYTPSLIKQAVRGIMDRYYALLGKK